MNTLSRSLSADKLNRATLGIQTGFLSFSPGDWTVLLTASAFFLNNLPENVLMDRDSGSLAPYYPQVMHQGLLLPPRGKRGEHTAVPSAKPAVIMQASVWGASGSPVTIGMSPRMKG